MTAEWGEWSIPTEITTEWEEWSELPIGARQPLVLDQKHQSSGEKGTTTCIANYGYNQLITTRLQNQGSQYRDHSWLLNPKLPTMAFVIIHKHEGGLLILCLNNSH